MKVNSLVLNITSEHPEQLEAKDVNLIRSAAREEWGGVISTFLDPDGNYCQLIEFRPQ